MSQIAIPVVYALLIWWVSTGAILYVVGRSRRTYPFSILVGLGLLAGALWALAAGSSQSTAWDAHVAFTSAVIVWGFVELTFLTGYVTGSRTTPCPAGSMGWQRARYAVETIIYHELALIAAGVAVLWATWDGVNYVAVATFLVLWVMRLSSKLNLFLGVRTLNDELLPGQLQHLRSYFLRKEMNALFPISVAGSGIVTALLIVRAIAPNATEFETAGYLLVASLLALALIEHAFMMLPVRVARLWALGRPTAPAIVTKSELATTSQARSTRDRMHRGRP
jgi:putative photosynthetic complex assembly protein 2